MSQEQDPIEKTQELLKTLEEMHLRLGMILRHTLEDYIAQNETPAEKTQRLLEDIKKSMTSSQVVTEQASNVIQFKSRSEEKKVSISDEIWGQKKSDDTTRFDFPF